MELCEQIILVAESNKLLGFSMTHSNTLGFMERETFLFKWNEMFCLTWSVLILKNENLERSDHIHKENFSNKMEVIICPSVV